MLQFIHPKLIKLIICLFVYFQADDSDEEDQCAISNNWKYLRSSGRWSRRLPSEDSNLSHDSAHSQESSPTLTHTTVRLRSSSSRESITTTDNEGYTSTSSFDSPAVVHKKYSGRQRPATTDVGEIFESDVTSKQPGCNRTSVPVDMETKPRRAIIEISSPILVKKTSPADLHFPTNSRDRMKGAKNLLKRLDSLKGRRGNSFRRKNKPEKGTISISGPVVTDEGLMQQKIELFNCIDLNPTPNVENSNGPDAVVMTPAPMRKRSNTGDKKDYSKRLGRVFSEPNSPVSHRKFDYEFEFLKELEDYQLNLAQEKLCYSDLDNNNDETRDNDNVQRTLGNRSPAAIRHRLRGCCSGSCSSTGTCCCSCSSDLSCQDNRGGVWKSTDELQTPNNANSTMNASSEVFDNMPRALHSSFEHMISDDDEDFAESEFMRQIHNLKNIGLNRGTSTPNDNTPTNRTPTHRPNDNANLTETTPTPSRKPMSHKEFESEKKDILISIKRLLKSERIEAPEVDLQLSPVQRKRTRSNSLPDTRPLKMREAHLAEHDLYADPEFESSVTDLSAELEQLLNGINESIHEMTSSCCRGEC